MGRCLRRRRDRRRGDRRGLLAVDGELAELLEHATGHRGAGEDLVVDEVLAGVDPADDGDQVLGADVLEDERRRPGLDGIEQLVLVLLHLLLPIIQLLIDVDPVIVVIVLIKLHPDLAKVLLIACIDLLVDELLVLKMVMKLVIWVVWTDLFRTIYPI